jgi:hypothetical protein
VEENSSSKNSSRYGFLSYILEDVYLRLSEGRKRGSS